MPRQNRSRTGAMSALISASAALRKMLDLHLEGGGTEDEFWKRLGDEGFQKDVVGLMAGWRGAGNKLTVETVTVPDVHSAALAEATRVRAGLTYVRPAYGSWDFVLDRRGKTYEVARWRPGRRVSSGEVRRHFRAEGGERPFLGNPAAFCALVGKDMPDGWCATIPEDEDCFRGVDGSLRAPYSSRDGARRELGLGAVAGDWAVGYCFFAFREVPR